MEFRLADWEHFRAQVDAEGNEAWITHARIIGDRILGDGHMLTPGGPPVENVWLHPEKVPSRIRRRDNAWPRIHPLEARAMCQRVPVVEEAPPELDEDGEEIAVETLPVPEVRARPATLAEIPQGARTVGKKAREQGFEQRATYSRGPHTNAKLALVEISDCIKLTGQHADGRWFAAVWLTRTGVKGKKAGVVEWKFLFAYVRDQDGVNIRCNATELSEYLVTPRPPQGAAP